MRRERLLAQITSRLREAFGTRLQGTVLYGSEARDEAEADSDIDVLILLTGPVHLWRDIQVALRALYPLSLEWDRPISPKPVDAAQYEAGGCPLYRRAQAEGVRA